MVNPSSEQAPVSLDSPEGDSPKLGDQQANPESADDQIIVGTVLGTHGYEGRLRVNPETDNPERYAKGSTVSIGGQPYTVQRSGPGPGGTVLLVKLAGVDSV
ncbi:MAG: hypothetical protein O3B65_02285, partial [Chloroflexi bacterium]|nr:hypothetical protein [Chloroflexota bacterium]